MRTPTVARTSHTVRRPRHHFRLVIVVAALLVLAAFAGYHGASRPSASPPSVRSAHAAPVDPATQSVLDYLRAHNIVQSPQPTVTLDPAQQSVMEYLRAHGVDQQGNGAPWDGAVQSVRDFLHAPSK